VAVAQLAGLPEAVLAQARAVLAQLEAGNLATGDPSSKQNTQRPQLDLFSTSSGPSAIGQDVLATLSELDPDRMTGIEALQLLHQLTARLKAQGKG
jgi:DNA mismatch repair protein MutS